MPLYVWAIFILAMLILFIVMYVKAGLKAVRVERGLGIFYVTANPAKIISHARRIFTSYRNACMEEGRNPVFAWVANVTLILALLGILCGLAQLVF
jgi:heme/copper-type cytochrome/quinol oxidase subunit 1